jgi:hypothetical protein
VIVPSAFCFPINDLVAIKIMFNVNDIMNI